MNTLLLVLAFAILAFLVYRYVKPRPAPKQAVEENTANLYFFYTNWCGFSQKAMPEWEKLENEVGYFGKTRVKAIRVDCEADKETCSLYGVDAYPTVLLETKDGLTDFNKRVTHTNLVGFLTSVLGKESQSL